MSNATLLACSAGSPYLFHFFFIVIAMIVAIVPMSLTLAAKGYQLGLLGGCFMVFIALVSPGNGAPITALVLTLAGGGAFALWKGHDRKTEQNTVIAVDVP